MDKDTARTRLAAAGTKYQAIAPTYDNVVRELGEAIEDARVAGLPQAETARLAGYARETIRRRWRAAEERERKAGAADEGG